MIWSGSDIYQRFVVDPPRDAIVLKVTWRDNAWFPDVLRSAIDDLKAHDFDMYQHVSMGECRQTLDGRFMPTRSGLPRRKGALPPFPMI